jgi:hypothetical protein
MSTEPSPAVLSAIWGNMCIDDVLLTNLKVSTLAEQYGELTVEAVWGPCVVWGGENEQAVEAVTHRDRLHLVHTSYKPVSGLLEKVVETMASERVPTHNSQPLVYQLTNQQ